MRALGGAIFTWLRDTSALLLLDYDNAISKWIILWMLLTSNHMIFLSCCLEKISRIFPKPKNCTRPRGSWARLWKNCLFQIALEMMSLPLHTEGGLMVSVLDSGSSGPGSGPGRGHWVVFLGRHFTPTVPLSIQVYKWVPAKCWG